MKTHEHFQFDKFADLLEGLGVQFERSVCGAYSGAGVLGFLGASAVRRAIGTEEKLRVAARSRADKCWRCSTRFNTGKHLTCGKTRRRKGYSG